MRHNPRDVHGDGHGFVDVPVVQRKREVTVAYKFDYNLQMLDTFPRGEEFLGLYDIDGTRMVRIIFRAKQRTEGLRFLTRHGSEHPHYIQDPIAWARLPSP